MWINILVCKGKFRMSDKNHFAISPRGESYHPPQPWQQYIVKYCVYNAVSTSLNFAISCHRKIEQFANSSEYTNKLFAMSDCMLFFFT